jgi:O-antigen ligase
MGSRLAVLVVLLFGPFFFLNLDVFLYLQGTGPKPLFAVLALAGAAILLARLPGSVPRRPLWRLTLVYAVLAMLGFLDSQLGELGWQSVQDIVLSLIFVSAWFAFLEVESARIALERVMVLGFLAAVAMNLYEVFHPLAMSQVFGRSSGTFLNPNQSALLLGFFSVHLLARGYRPAISLGILILSGLGIFSTFSRGGLASWVVAVVVQLFFIRRIGVARVLLYAGVTIGALVAALSLLPSEIAGSGDVMERLGSVSGSQFQDEASLQRMELLRKGWEKFAERPLLGHGPGAAEQIQIGGEFMGTHNEYLSVAVNAGIAGLLAWLLYLIHGWRHGSRPVVALLAVSSFFTHDLLQFRPLLLGLVLMESSSAAEKDQEGGEV